MKKLTIQVNGKNLFIKDILDLNDRYLSELSKAVINISENDDILNYINDDEESFVTYDISIETIAEYINDLITDNSNYEFINRVINIIFNNWYGKMDKIDIYKVNDLYYLDMMIFREF